MTILTTLAAPIIALDVGGTAMKGARIGRDGTILDEHQWTTPRANGPDAIVDAVLRVVSDLYKSTDDPKAIGIVVPGVVDDGRGVAVFSENLLWRDIRFRDLIAAKTSLPTAVGHDVRAGGRAEWQLGAGHGVDDGLFMPIGTGISGAMRVQGRFVTHPLAGEIGHIDVGTAEPCACGSRGCLETVASAASIARRYEQATGESIGGAHIVVDRLMAGDEAAGRVWNDAIDGLVRALTVYTTLLAPTTIVIGGGVSRAGAALFEPLQQRLAESLVWQEAPTIVPAALGDRAGCIGAGLLARELIDNHDHDRAGLSLHQQNGSR